MITLEDYDYVMRRLRRDPSSATGEAIRLIFVHGKLPVEAIRNCGLPMVRLMPVYEEARQIIAGMHLTEADGFTPDELPLANRALAVARSKESLYLPNIAEFAALEKLKAAGGSAVKAMNGSVDELPGIASDTLWKLEGRKAVEAVGLGGALFQWTLTPAGRKLVDERFK